ncbi:hypothetical protein ABG067_003622 [Albugo candida]
MDDETPQNMLLALERDGILALRNIPNYQRIRDAYFEIATKCVLEAKPEDSQSFVSSKTFGDGTQRATISSEAGLNLNSAGFLADAACPGYRDRYLDFSRALENAVNTFAQALEKSSFEIYDQDQLISIREMINEATRLDHFHLYEGTENEVEANPTSNHAHRLSSEELSVSLHEDRGLFIVMASPQFSRASKQGRLNSMQVEPDDRGLIIQQGDGQFVRPILHDAEIVIMMGTGATEWLRTSHILPPVTHGMKMLTYPSVSEERVTRAFFGKMILLPLYQRVSPSRFTFAEILNKTYRHVSGIDILEPKEIGCASSRQLVEAAKPCYVQVSCEAKADFPKTDCSTICNRNHTDDAEKCKKYCQGCQNGGIGNIVWMQCIPDSAHPPPSDPQHGALPPGPAPVSPVPPTTSGPVHPPTSGPVPPTLPPDVPAPPTLPLVNPESDFAGVPAILSHDTPVEPAPLDNSNSKRKSCRRVIHHQPQLHRQLH